MTHRFLGHAELAEGFDGLNSAHRATLEAPTPVSNVYLDITAVAVDYLGLSTGRYGAFTRRSDHTASAAYSSSWGGMQAQQGTPIGSCNQLSHHSRLSMPLKHSTWRVLRFLMDHGTQPPRLIGV